MKLPRQVISRMNTFADMYSKEQLQWYHENLHNVLRECDFHQSYYSGDKKCSHFSPMDARNGNRSVKISRINRTHMVSVQQTAETVWHEYGHYLFEKIHLGGFKGILEKELKQFFKDEDPKSISVEKMEENLASSIEKWQRMPTMITDSVGMMMGKELEKYSCHEAGYPDSNMETEVFAEYFSAIMSNDYQTIALFRELCPRTERFLNKKVTWLFK